MLTSLLPSTLKWATSDHYSSSFLLLLHLIIFIILVLKSTREKNATKERQIESKFGYKIKLFESN